MYCFDTDVLSAAMRRAPDLALIRRLAELPPAEQFTTALTLGELLYGAERRGSARLREKVRGIVAGALTVLPFDEAAAEVYGLLRAGLEADGRRLDEPDLRIASIALARDLTLVTASPQIAARFRTVVLSGVPYLRAGRAERPGTSLPESTEELLLGGLVALLARSALAGDGATLEARLPDLIDFTLAPYLGAGSARRFAGQGA